ncbi:MAG: hypothetical protein ACAH80_04135 [Alphaproteobacteria bacterium]
MSEIPRDNDQPKKLTWRQRAKIVFDDVSKREAFGVIKETAKDLRKGKEIAILAGSSVIPGGWIGYGAYRIAKYRSLKKAANDNKPPEGEAPAPKKPRRGKKPNP